jgi:hypothetical protein
MCNVRFGKFVKKPTFAEILGGTAGEDITSPVFLIT